MRISLISTAALAITVNASAETLIPRSVSGDKGKYYLIEVRRSGDIVSSLHKRVGVDSIGYTRTEINCSSMKMREIGYSEAGPSDIKRFPAVSSG